MPKAPSKPRFFATPADFRAWLKQHHATEQELSVGFYKKGYFQAQPAWYRKQLTWWVVSAKREETRQKRLVALIENSAKGRRL